MPPKKPKLDPKKGGKPSNPQPGSSKGTGKEPEQEPAPDYPEVEPIFGTSILPQDYGKIVVISCGYMKQDVIHKCSNG